MIRLTISILNIVLHCSNATQYDGWEPDGINEMLLSCPKLTCAESALAPGKCYLHDGQATSEEIIGGLCYDVENAKQTD